MWVDGETYRLSVGSNDAGLGFQRKSEDEEVPLRDYSPLFDPEGGWT